MSGLEVSEGQREQSADEEIIYTLTTTPWGSSPTNVAVTAYDESRKSVVTSTVFPANSPTVDGDVITLSPLKALIKGHIYRVEVKFTSGGNIYEAYFNVKCVI